MSTVKTVSSPWKPQQTHILNVFDEANRLRQNPIENFQGQTFAGATANDTAAQQYLQNFATGAAQSATSNAIGALDFGLNAPNLASNPYVQDYVTAATNPLYERLTEEALPAIRSGANLAGQAGSSRQALAEGLAIRGTQRAAGETSANILNDAYGKGLDTYAKTLALTPQTVDAGTLPARYLGAAGEQQRAFEQMAINDAMQKFNFDQYEPYQRLGMYKDFITGNYGGTTTQKTETGSSGFLGKALGGISTGAGVFGALGGGSLGGALGIGSGLLAAFS